MKQLILTANNAEPKRLDAAIAELTDEISRSAAARLLDSGNVFLNGVAVPKSVKVKRGDVITVTLPEPLPEKSEPEDIPIEIVFEDDDLLVVNKPKGMVVHPAPGNYSGTLVNALLSHCRGSLSGIGGVIRPGIVHRIDKDTSGLLIAAKNDFAHLRLAQQIKDHSFTREYAAVVIGNIKDDSGTVDAPIGRHPQKRKQMAVTDRFSRNAVTHYEVLARLRGYTVVRCILETGRTHQIRVHMAYIGHPVAGDPLYGGGALEKKLGGQCLHAKKIGFIHPRTGEYLCFESDLPAYFKDFIKRNEQ